MPKVIKQGSQEGKPAPSYEAHCYGCGSIIGFRADEAKQVISLLEHGRLTVECPVCKHPISVYLSQTG